MKARLLFLGMIALAGCETAEITTPPISVQPKTPSQAVGIDVYARARAQGNPVPRFRGQETVQVRTQGKTSNGFGEITGIECLLDSGLYSARFQTPANINVPDYGPNSPALFVRCTHPDGRSGSATVNIYNFTSQQRSAAAVGTGVLGAIVIGAVNAASTDNETDEFKYPNITVQLK